MPVHVESQKTAQHSTWIEIRLDRLKFNLEKIKEHAAPYAEIFAVVKANAYGHGLIQIAKALEGQVAYLGVSSIHEALDLKENGVQTPILLFGRSQEHELPTVLIDGLTLSVSSFEEAKEISAMSSSLGRKTPIHIKVDTGMGRLGIPFPVAFKEIEKISDLGSIRLEGIYTHFPVAEREDGFTESQVQDFGLLLAALEKKGITFRYRHAANGAGSLKIKSPIFNLVRPGLLLYGLYPDEGLQQSIEVLPILSLKSRVILTKRIATGASVGYGRSFVADKPTTIATLPIGYSHGYPFSASNQAFIVFEGKRFPIAGRVSMDYLSINLGDHSAHIGDTFTLIGEDHGEMIRAEELAAWAHTIPYEIVTRLSSRLPRFYRP